MTLFLKKLTVLAHGTSIYYKRYGFRNFLGKVLQKIFSSKRKPELKRAYDAALYRNWIRMNEPKKKVILAQNSHRFDHEPVISLIVPCHKTPIGFLRDMVQSVQLQSYKSWQLHLVIAGDVSPEVASYLEEISVDDTRIDIVKLTTNLGISDNTNTGLNRAQGEYIGLIDHDDTIAPFALYEIVKAINKHPEAELIYSDEDKITQHDNIRHSPHFKPDWSPDLLRSYNYITHFMIIKKSLLSRVGILQTKFDSCQDYDLALRASEKARYIHHIPLVLYHWREHIDSTSTNTNAKPEVGMASIRAIEEHLKRVGREGRVKPGPFFGSVNINYALLKSPLISIIIPNHDHSDDLETCINSILEKSTYKNYEIIIMENHSQEDKTFKLYNQLLKSKQEVRIVKWDKPFSYSEINNMGVEKARGSVLLFLNNDVEVITPDWLEQMLMHLQYSETGAVGAKLYYPDKSIQHAGVVVGIGGIAGHPHKGFSYDSLGYFGRLKVAQNLSSVTGACLMIKVKIFEEVGGFNLNLPIAFNDIDLCLRVRQAGYLITWTPDAELFHHESKTRGLEDTKEKQQRFLGEVDYFKRKWSNVLSNGDPYYSPNLTYEKEDFSINAK